MKKRVAMALLVAALLAGCSPAAEPYPYETHAILSATQGADDLHWSLTISVPTPDPIPLACQVEYGQTAVKLWVTDAPPRPRPSSVPPGIGPAYAGAFECVLSESLGDRDLVDGEKGTSLV
ncbi:hypothetical protein ACSDQ9_09905 [Aestuariimicrobium soli]|uniref:hypothetical protein n=1 Tax=Aestuariimicrobium soli TaxID=2035834 RepID=UPI003EBC2782